MNSHNHKKILHTLQNEIISIYTGYLILSNNNN